MFEQFLEINLKNNLLYWVIGIIIFVVLIKKYLSKYIARFIYNVFKKIGREPEKDAYYKLLVKPLQNFVVACVIILSLEKLTLPDEVNQYSIYGSITIQYLLNVISKIILIVLFTNLLIKIIDYIAIYLVKKANLTVAKDDDQLIVFFKDFFKVILFIVGFLLILKYAFGQNIGNLLTGLSLVGAAIALATKESLENLIASIVIFFDKPFVTGDILKVQNVEGTVEKIGLRSTRIRTLDKTYVTVPNKQMVDSIVDNKSLRTQHKIFITLDLDKCTSNESIMKLSKEIESNIKSLSNVVFCSVILNEIVKEGLRLQIICFLKETEDRLIPLIKQQINFDVLNLIKLNEIKFAENKV